MNADFRTGEGHDDRHRHCERDEPGDYRGTPLPAREVLRLDLVACEQEQKRHAELGEQADRIRHAPDVEGIGPENGARDEQQHRFGNELVGNSVRHERHDCRYDGDDCKR